MTLELLILGDMYTIQDILEDMHITRRYILGNMNIFQDDLELQDIMAIQILCSSHYPSYKNVFGHDSLKL